jgi:hypothetical protein
MRSVNKPWKGMDQKINNLQMFLKVNGFTLKATFKAEPQAKVIDKSLLSGTVQLNESVEMTAQKGDFSQTTSLNTKTLLYLKKMSENTWKIYDVKPLPDSNGK